MAQLFSLDGMRLRISFLAVMLSCSGCLPVRWHDTPHVTGSVFDAATAQPIAGARLHYIELPKHEVYTGADGQFDFPSISHWSFFVLLPIDRIPPHSVLSVEASGYSTTNAPFLGWYDHTNKVFHMIHQ